MVEAVKVGVGEHEVALHSTQTMVREIATLGGDVGKFVQPLVHELNALLESNQDIITRARTQVGNLAHALKTPLSG